MNFTFDETNTFRNVGIGTTNNKIIIMNISKSNNLSFHSTTNDTNVDIMSIKTILNKDSNNDLNISSFNGTQINPVIKINNTEQHVNITNNLNVLSNLNVSNNINSDNNIVKYNLIVPKHSQHTTTLDSIEGSIYYNTNDNLYYSHNHEEWLPLGGINPHTDTTINHNLNILSNLNVTGNTTTNNLKILDLTNNISPHGLKNNKYYTIKNVYSGKYLAFNPGTTQLYEHTDFLTDQVQELPYLYDLKNKFEFIDSITNESLWFIEEDLSSLSLSSFNWSGETMKQVEIIFKNQAGFKFKSSLKIQTTDITPSFLNNQFYISTHNAVGSESYYFLKYITVDINSGTTVFFGGQSILQIYSNAILNEVNAPFHFTLSEIDYNLDVNNSYLNHLTLLQELNVNKLNVTNDTTFNSNLNIGTQNENTGIILGNTLNPRDTAASGIRGSVWANYSSIPRETNLNEIVFAGCGGTDRVCIISNQLLGSGTTDGNTSNPSLVFSTKGYKNSANYDKPYNMVITPDGYIGIGTNNPERALEIAGSDLFNSSRIKIRSNSDHNSVLEFCDKNNQMSFLYKDNNLVDTIKTESHLKVGKSLAVGIGTSHSTFHLATEGVSTVLETTKMYFGEDTVPSNFSTLARGIDYNQIIFRGFGGNDRQFRIGTRLLQDGSSTLWTNSNPSLVFGSKRRIATGTTGLIDNDHVVITDIGNVGIGNMIPSEKLVVTGNIEITGNFIGNAITNDIKITDLTNTNAKYGLKNNKYYTIKNITSDKYLALYNTDSSLFVYPATTDTADPLNVHFNIKNNFKFVDTIINESLWTIETTVNTLSTSDILTMTGKQIEVTFKNKAGYKFRASLKIRNIDVTSPFLDNDFLNNNFLMSTQNTHVASSHYYFRYIDSAHANNYNNTNSTSLLTGDEAWLQLFSGSIGSSYYTNIGFHFTLSELDYSLNISDNNESYLNNLRLFGNLSVHDTTKSTYVEVGGTSTYINPAKYPLEVIKPHYTNYITVDLGPWTSPGKDSTTRYISQSDIGTMGSLGNSVWYNPDPPPGPENAGYIVAKFNGNIWIHGNYVFITSDKRIKKNITDVDNNIALNKLRNIPCRFFEYIDKIDRGNKITMGFIAQEVKSILSMAISDKKTDIIPDIYKEINCTWTSKNDKFLMSSTDLENVNNIKYRFYVSNNNNANDQKMIEVVGNSDNTFTFDNKYTNIFCYGKEVNDLHILDKNTLFTLNFSATKEIDKIQQEHNTRIVNLENENTILKTENELLKTKLNELTGIVNKLKISNTFEEFKQAI